MQRKMRGLQEMVLQRHRALWKKVKEVTTAELVSMQLVCLPEWRFAVFWLGSLICFFFNIQSMGILSVIARHWTYCVPQSKGKQQLKWFHCVVRKDLNPNSVTKWFQSWWKLGQSLHGAVINEQKESQWYKSNPSFYFWNPSLSEIMKWQNGCDIQARARPAWGCSIMMTQWDTFWVWKAWTSVNCLQAFRRHESEPTTAMTCFSSSQAIATYISNFSVSCVTISLAQKCTV